MDVVNYKKIQNFQKDQAIAVYLQEINAASQNYALQSAFAGKVGLMVQYALADSGSTVTWADIETWEELQDTAAAVALMEANAAVHKMFRRFWTLRQIGIALVATGGRTGTWQTIDAWGDSISTPAASYFDTLAPWSGIVTETIDGQAMVKIPKFYIKYGTGPAGSDMDGKVCRWISGVPATGYKVHPAFMNAGSEVGHVYVGAYECSDGGSSKAASVSGAAPLVAIDFPTMRTRCTNRNAGGVTGFRMWDIYQVSAIQLLALIEKGNPDMQSLVGAGNTSTSAAVNTGASTAVYRGIYELWGNVSHMVDGLKAMTDHEIRIWDNQGNQQYQATGVISLGPAWDGWVTGLHTQSSAAWDLSDVFLPSAVTASEGNGFLADYFYSSRASENVCYHGGSWGDGSDAGLFFLPLRYVSSDSRTSFGARLAKV